MKSKLLAPVLAVLMSTASAGAAVPTVAVDIAPIHSIVARVMDGVGTPGLILPPGASPHGYALRPSEARLLQSADLVVWVGPALTPWLADPIAALAPQAQTLTLETEPGQHLLAARASGPFEAHVHDEDDEHHDGHDHAHEHGGSVIDGHLWLDPENAVAAARAVAAALAAHDPDNASVYAANADAFAAEVAALDATIEARVAPLRGRPYIVFHDGYQYFEHAFDLPAAGSIVLHEGAEPGAARVAEIRDRIRSEAVVCAFSEPEFPPALLDTVTEGTEVRRGALDGIGARLEPGAALYPALMTGIADGFAACLAGPAE